MDQVVVVGVKPTTQSAVQVHHRGDPVEAKTVEAILLHPEADIAQQEAQHLHLAVVEDERIPHVVPPLWAGVEILVLGSVELVESVVDVLDRMAMDQVQQHAQTQAVGRVDQVFEVLGRAEAGRRSVEVAHVISEGAVVGVLHDGHELHGVVAEVGDARQHLFGELVVGPDFLLFLRHTDVGFVAA